MDNEFYCNFCGGYFDGEIYRSSVTGSECCYDCIEAEEEDGYYECDMCGGEILCEELTFNDSGLPCHIDCLANS